MKVRRRARRSDGTAAHARPAGGAPRAVQEDAPPPAEPAPVPSERTRPVDHVAADPTGQAEPLRSADGNGSEAAAACTPAQLRRFIKSRPYVPMHELRRRFALNGESDEVTRIRTRDGDVFVGLPARESQLIEELVGQGEVGLEICRDPSVPVAVGLFALRPMTRG